MHRCSSLPVVLALALSCSPSGRPGSHPRASHVQVLAEPDAGPGAVLSLIAAASRAVWMEMYLLTDADAIAALVDRRAAGCDVRVLLEPHPYLDDGANDLAFATLSDAGVTVRWANPRFALTHAKVATIDHHRLAVLTLNLTRAGLRGNREYLAVDDDPADVAAAEAVMAADLAGAADPGPAAGASAVVTSPAGTRGAVTGLVAGATRTLAVEMEELSDPALVGALMAAAARGVLVAVGLPADGASAATSAAATRLADVGVGVRAVAAPPVHAKAIVADGARLYVGSANLTTASLDANREVGLVVDDPAAGALVSYTIASDLAAGSGASGGSPR